MSRTRKPTGSLNKTDSSTKASAKSSPENEPDSEDGDGEDTEEQDDIPQQVRDAATLTPPSASDDGTETPASSDIHRSRWTDEYVLLLWSIPLVAAFVPFLQPYVQAGFKLLTDDVPPWYVQVWGIIAAGVFGINKISNLAELHMMTRHLRK